MSGKPLVEIAGNPIIQHVWEHARQAKLLDKVIVATAYERIAKTVGTFGGEATLTSQTCASGTDRLREAM